MPMLINPLMTSAYDVTVPDVSSMTSVMMMMMMMYRSAAAAVRYVAPSPAVEWTQMLTAMTTAGGRGIHTDTVPSVSWTGVSL